MNGPAVTILVIDDNLADRRLLEAFLQPEGYLTVLAGSGQEALASVARAVPDLILLDVMMAGRDGYDILRTLKADRATSRVPVIMVTALSDRSARLDGLKAGAEDFLTKPVDRAELSLRVRNLLRQSRLEARLRATLESSPTAMAMIDERGILVFVNSELERLFGYDRNELVGTSADQLLPERFRGEVRDLRARFFAAPRARALGAGPPLSGLRKDGQEFPIEDGLNPVTTDEGVFLLVAIVDITERRRRESALRQACETLERGNVEMNEVLAGAGLAWETHESDSPPGMFGSIVPTRRAEEATDRNTDRILRSALVTERSRAALLGVLADQQKTSQDLSRTNRALKMLSRSNELLIRAEDEASLLSEVCRIAVEDGGYRMAWVGYAQDDAQKSIKPMAHAGADESYLSAPFSWNEAVPEGRGPAGRVIQTGTALAWEDLNDDATLHSPVARRLGYRGVVGLPLMNGARTFGLLGLYSLEARGVNGDEMSLLKRLANDLAFGIGAIRSRFEQRRAETDLVASVKEKEALLKEVHHRVKNNLQVITSLLRIESRRIVDPATINVLGDMRNRIQAMALLHETIYRSGNFAQVNAATYLQQLATHLFRAQSSRVNPVLLEIDVDPVGLDIDQAIPCGLIVNELASNGLKHGFNDGRDGSIRIELKPSGPGGLFRLRVTDTGTGLGPERLNREGSLGLQLVADLARQLRGRFDIGPGPEAVFDLTFTPAAARPPRGEGLAP